MSSRVNCSIITVAGSFSPHLGNLPKSGTIEKKNFLWNYLLLEVMRNASNIRLFLTQKTIL